MQASCLWRRKEERQGIWIDEHIERSVPRIAGNEVRLLNDEDAQDRQVDTTTQEGQDMSIYGAVPSSEGERLQSFEVEEAQFNAEPGFDAQESRAELSAEEQGYVAQRTPSEGVEEVDIAQKARERLQQLGQQEQGA